jgi:hypothetical protein
MATKAKKRYTNLELYEELIVLDKKLDAIKDTLRLTQLDVKAGQRRLEYKRLTTWGKGKLLIASYLVALLLWLLTNGVVSFFNGNEFHVASLLFMVILAELFYLISRR